MKRNILFLKNNFALFLVVLVFLIQQTAMGQIQSLTSTTPVCLGESSTITVSSDGFLESAPYTVTYSLSGANTATDISIGMSGTLAGTRTFTVPTTSLTSSGTTTVTITQITDGIYPDGGANNTVNITSLLPFTAGEISNTGETICSGNIPIQTIGSVTDASGGDNSIVYQWQYSTDSSFLTDVTTISDSSTDPNSPPPPIRLGSVIGATYIPTQTLTQTTYYRRQAKDGSCNTAFTGSSGIWTVTVNPSPDLSNFSTSASDACIGFASQITISSTTLADGNYNVTYLLSDANSGTDTKNVSFIGGSGTFNTIQLNNFGNTAVTITNIESSGCSVVPTTGQASIFTVDEIVIASVSISTSSTILCISPSNKTFTATTINGGPFTLYQWKVNGVVVSSSASNVFTYSASLGDKVWCDAYSLKSCATPKPTISNEITMLADTVAPLISCPANVTVSADAGLCTASGVLLGNAPTTDNCGVISVTNNAPANFSIGTTTVTWTVIDVSGNTASCTQDVTVTDTENPVLTVPTTGLALGCNPAILPTEANVVSASSATDNCLATMTAVAGAITGSCSKSQDFTVTAIDGSGNTDVKTVTYTWTADTENPVLTVPATGLALGCNPATLSTEASVIAASSTTDNCSATITAVAGAITGSCSKSQDFTVTATDGCTNTDVKTVTYTWTEDLVAPVLTVPTSGLALGCNPATLPTAASVIAASSVADACGAVITASAGAVTGDCSKEQIFTVTATDNCGGLTDVETVTYTWTEDLVAPVLTVPTTGLALGCNPATLPTEASVIAASSVADACGAVITASAGAVTGDCSKEQIFTVTATDNCGGLTDVENVTYTWIEDITKPIIATTAVSEDKGCNPTIVAPVFTLTEACSPGTIVVVDSGVTGAGCAKSQTWSANFTDGCGNIADEVVVTYTWTEDITKPIIATTAVSEDKGCNPTIVAPVFTLTEACSPGTIVVVDSGVTGAGCAKSQTWTANFTDACGNIADEIVVTYTWTEDVDKPIITTTAVSEDKDCNPTIVAPVFTLTEVCSPGTIVVVDSGVTGAGCAKSQTWTANFTDGCGNIADEVVVTYTWTEDITKPIIATTAVSEDKGCNPTIVAPVFTLTEACSPGTIVVVDSGVTGAGCAKSQTWSANFTDGCGNIADEVVVTYTWTEDVDKPIITTTAVSEDKGCNPTIVAPVFTLTEACSPGTIVVVDSGVTEAGCAKSQTWTANFTDGCGNIADEVVVTYTWTEDLVAPVLTVPTTGLALGCNPVTLPTVASVIAASNVTDACGTPTITAVAGTITGTCSKSQEFTVTAMDGCTNTDVKTVTYTWSEDIELPVIALTAAGTLGYNPTVADIEAAFGSATVTDNCSAGLTATGIVEGETGSDCTFATTKYWTVTDACGNTGTASQTITYVRDLDNPVITCPNTLVIGTNTACAYVGTIGQATATDNCSAALDLIITNDAPAAFPLGTTTVTWTATDTAGNTQTCTQIISVFGAADAVDDISGPINGLIGGNAGINVLDNDVLNCSAVIPSQVTITSTSSAELKLNSDGSVTVTPGTPAGSYIINYQICEILNPTNCDTATVTVDVTTIDAVNDASTAVNGTTGGTTPSIFTNDTLNGTAFLPADVILTSLPLASGLTLNSDGTIAVEPGTALGTYSITYTICQAANPTICDTATTSVIVTSIDAVAYVLEPEISTTGGTVLSVFDNDTLNGLPFLSADVILTSLPLASGLTLNSDGTITVAPGTQAGIYPLTYTICQVANPTICDTASTNIIVIGSSVSTPSPSMSLTKEGTYVDSNGDGKTNVGDTVFYNFVVTNTGNVVLSNIIVTDTNVTVTGGSIDFLAVGASNSSTFTAIHTITQADIDTGQVDNLALASGNASAGVTITATSTDPTPCVTCVPIDPNCSVCTIVLLNRASSISLIAKAVLNDSNGDGIAQAGEIIHYSYIITNTGNVTLSDITVTDQLPGLVITGEPITLAPGQSDTITFIGTYVLTLQDLLNGKVINQSIVSAKDQQGNIISDLSDDDDGLGDDPTVIEINGCEIIVYNALSPNDSSGINDALIISGIECYPNNSVEIFNRWGVLVFEVKGYDNVTNVFRGVSDGRGTVGKDSNLPDGTYFYVLKYSKSTGEYFQKTGYLYLKN